MKIYVRIYKRWDLDLIALIDHGYPVRKMIEESLTAYARGRIIKYDLGKVEFFDLNSKQSCNIQIQFRDNSEVAKLLRNIKHSYKNAFVKMVLRNSLLMQGIPYFFADDSSLMFHKIVIDRYKENDYKIIKVNPEENTSQIETKRYNKSTHSTSKPNNKHVDYSKKTKKNTEIKPVIQEEPASSFSSSPKGSDLTASEPPNLVEQLAAQGIDLNLLQQLLKAQQGNPVSKVNSSPAERFFEEGVSDETENIETLSDDETDAMMQVFSGLL